MESLKRFSSSVRTFFVPLLGEIEYDKLYNNYYCGNDLHVSNQDDNVINLIVKEPLKLDFLEMVNCINKLSSCCKQEIILKLNELLRSVEKNSPEFFYMTALKYAVIGDKNINVVYYYKNALEYVLRDCQLNNNLRYFREKRTLIANLISRFMSVAKQNGFEVDISEFLDSYHFPAELNPCMNKDAFSDLDEECKKIGFDLYRLHHNDECVKQYGFVGKIKSVFIRHTSISNHLSMIDRIMDFAHKFSLSKSH